MHGSGSCCSIALRLACADEAQVCAINFVKRRAIECAGPDISPGGGVMHRSFKYKSVLVGSLIVGCVEDPEFALDDPRAFELDESASEPVEVNELRERPEANVELGESTTDFDELQLRYTGDGRVAALFFRDRRPIFEYEDDPQNALQDWVRGHTRELGFVPDATGADLLELELDREWRHESGLVVHRYAQRYRGYPISGPDEVVSLTSVDGAVISVVGAFMDSSIELAGFEDPIDRQRAAALALTHAERDAELVELELVAMSELETMAWMATVEGSTGRVHIALAADTGELLSERSTAANDSFDHHPVSINAYELGDDPGTTTTAMFYNQPGSSWTGSWNAQYGWLLRMGTDRLLPFSLGFNNNSVPSTSLTQQLWPNTNVPYSAFVATPASNANAFRTQNLFHKVNAALDELDTRHSPFGWDHPPGSPFGVFTPRPLNLITNIDKIPDYTFCDEDSDCASNDCEEGYCHCADDSDCSGTMRCLSAPVHVFGSGPNDDVCREMDFCEYGQAKGVYSGCSPNGAQLQVPYPGVQTSCLYSCDGVSQTTFHELGHYVDDQATYGIMGSSVNSNTCVYGTTDEAIPLRETLSDMTALYLVKQLYSVDYTASATDEPCTFDSLIQSTNKIHNSTCISAASQLGWWPDDQANISDEDGECDYYDGYRVRSVSQAVWAWLNRRTCGTSSPYTCYMLLVGGDGSEFMDGMIYAMGLSNAQSYETFFENIETYIWATESQYMADWFRTIMAKYGILDP
jgi:hypothetical protein